MIWTQAASRLIRFVYVIIVARLLGPDVTGLYLYGFSLYIGLSTFANFGQGPILAARIGKNKKKTEFILGMSLSTTIATSLIASAAVILILVTTGQKSDLAALWWFAPALFFRAMVSWVRLVFLALEDAIWIAKYESFFRTAEAILGVIVIVLWENLAAVCFVHFLGWFIETIACWRKYRRDVSVVPMLPTWRRIRPLLLASVWVMASLWSMQFFSQAGTIMVQHAGGEERLAGYFAIAMQFLTVFVMIPEALGLVFMPALRRGFVAAGRQITALRLTMKAVHVFGTLASVLCFAYLPQIVVVLFGEEYRQSAKLIEIMCWGIGSYALLILLAQVLAVMNRKRSAGILGASVLCLHVAIFLFSSDSDVTIAAAWSVVIATTVGAHVGCVIVAHSLGEISDIWWLKAMVLWLSCGIALISIPVSTTLTAPVIAVAVLIVAWKWHIFSQAEVALLRELLSRRIGKGSSVMG